MIKLFAVSVAVLPLFVGMQLGAPAVAHLECPHYPPLARQAQIQGKVNMHVSFDGTGRVLAATANSGHTILRAEAEENVKKWIFSADREGGLDITYEFRLDPPKGKGVPPPEVTFDLPTRVLIVSHAPVPIDDTVTVHPRP